LLKSVASPAGFRDATYGVYAADTIFASQISISLQHDPYSPVPAFLSLADAFHPTELALHGSQLNVTNPDLLKSCCSKKTYFSVDELNILRTLGITVSSSVLGTSLICGVLAHSPVCIHLCKVKSAVKTAREVRHVNVEREFLTQQLKHLIFSCAASGHQVCSRADIGRTAALRYKAELDGVAAGRDAISAGVVSSIQSAVGGASLAIWAKGCIPSVTSVAIGVPGLSVEPSPVGVEDN
jgi:hypothetical protein